jgi:citrate lyase subunit beta/citryl-CoA lyase
MDLAVEIITAAQAADWAPIRHRDTLHDRASYRYFWHVLERAHRTRQHLPSDVQDAFFAEAPQA